VALISYIGVKRAAQRTAGYACLLLRPFTARSQAGLAGILLYHRVAGIDFVDPYVDDFNVPPTTFERQIAAVAESCEVVALSELPSRLNEPSTAKPLISLTFDDGYANFHTQALPVLKRYGVPATVFVVTDLIGKVDPPHHDGWSQKHRNRVSLEAFRSMSWREIEACIAGGLVHVGSHSHRHLKGTECSPNQLLEETERSRAILRQRLGDTHGNVFAYPYGTSRLGFVPPEYVHAVKSAGYELAVCTDVGLASVECDRYLLPRIEVHAVDKPYILRAKACGVIGPYRLLALLRSARHLP
jgi:peptidoglycan/xylan/chitin deacetylase (PgdA/CDA1 family)